MNDSYKLLSDDTEGKLPISRVVFIAHGLFPQLLASPLSKGNFQLQDRLYSYNLLVSYLLKLLMHFPVEMKVPIRVGYHG